MRDRRGLARITVRPPGRALLGLAAVLGLMLARVEVTAQSRDAEEGRRLIMERMIEEIREDHPDVATISAAALREALPTGDFVLVDVRTERERRVSTLPGAIAAGEFEQRLAELADRTVVVYCTIGARSSSYARKMGRRGVNVLNLEGSVLAWTHAGGPLVHGVEPTKRLHVYGRRWNLAADDYETVW